MDKIPTPPSKPVQTKRLIGSYTGDKAGKLVLIFGGVHGNETSGVIALERLFEEIERIQPPFRGRVVGLGGNLAALERGSRFVDRDLNRAWTAKTVRRIREAPVETLELAEEREVAELLPIIDKELAGTYEHAIFIDLHGTSASGGGFCLIRATEDNKQLAAKLFMPLVYGLEEKLHGTIQHHLYSLGLSGLTFEGGQIGHPSTMETHLSGLWVMLVSLGCLHAKDIDDFRRQVNKLLNAAEYLPKSVRVDYRHAISPDDDYKMVPGFHNFQQVLKGHLLGRDRNGEVYAPIDGLLLMPLYQDQGEDGFFLCTPVDY